MTTTLGIALLALPAVLLAGWLVRRIAAAGRAASPATPPAAAPPDVAPRTDPPAEPPPAPAADGRIEGRVSRRSSRAVAGLAERHPAETVAALRRWMKADDGDR